MSKITKLLFLGLVCLLLFFYRDEIGFSKWTIPLPAASSSAQKPLHRGEWGQLRSKVINISHKEDPLVMIALFNEYEEKLQAELTEATFRDASSSSGIPMEDLTCELGIIYRKLADAYLLQENDERYMHHLYESQRYFAECETIVDDKRMSVTTM